MAPQSYPRRRQAARMLLLATLFWGVSFPIMRAMALAQEQRLPEHNSWFTSSSAVGIRFGAAMLVMLAVSWKTLPLMTRREVWQGLWLGFFGGIGILLQMDGLAYTSASTSAFLTQCYCILLPLIVAGRDRQWPSWHVVASTLLVLAGIAVLARFDWHTLRLGRGELETLAGSFMFTGQILVLDWPRFARNRINHVTLVMFAGMVLTALPVCVLSTKQPQDWRLAYGSLYIWGLLAILVGLCTLISYVFMNRWQPQVPATEAGLIYAVEPLFASMFALFLPEILAAWGGFHYENEQTTANLLLGGGLITAANALIQFQSATRATGLENTPPADAEANTATGARKGDP